MVTAITRIAERFSTLGLSTATVQAPKITHQQCSNLFWINAAVGLVFATLLVLFSPAISNFYEDSRLQPIAFALSLNFISTGLTVQHEALLRRQMRLPQIAGNRLVATLISVGLAVALALSGFGYWALVWKEMAQALLIALGSWWLCPWIPGLPKRHVNMNRLLGFGRDMTLTQLLIAVSAQLDSLLIGRFAGASVLGLYRQAYNLMMAPMERIRGPIYSVSQPSLSILQGQDARYLRYYQRILFAVTLVTVPLGVFALLYAREIVLVALGENWLGAVVFLRIFSVVAAIQPALGTSGIVMVTRGKSGRFLLVALVSSSLLLVLMLVGIHWGAIGIASGRVLAPLLVMPWALHYAFAGSPVSIRDFVRSAWKPLLASLMMGAGLLLLRYFVPLENALLSLLMGCSASALLYLVAFNLLPGGRAQLQSLVQELLAVLRRRSPKKATETDVS